MQKQYKTDSLLKWQTDQKSPTTSSNKCAIVVQVYTLHGHFLFYVIFCLFVDETVVGFKYTDTIPNS